MQCRPSSLAVLALTALWSVHCHAAAPESGLWYDRQHAGHGLDLHYSRSVLFGAFYTYAESGRSQWLWIQTDADDAPAGELTRYRRTAGDLQGRVAGQFSLTPVDGCSDGLARPGARALLEFEFQLDQFSARWCLEPLLPQAADPHAVLSGAWYDPTDPGWGLLAHHYPRADGSSETYRTLYFHGSDGEPRWAFAQQSLSLLDASWDFYTPFAECFGCAPPVSLTVPAGSARIALQQASPVVLPERNRIDLDLNLDGDPFQRQTSLALLSDPRSIPAAASTAEGPLRGVLLDQDIEVFRGIPYVSAPVAELRWRAPQPLALRERLLDAGEFGPACLQPEGQGFFGATPELQSEDCLQLNIWRPAVAEAGTSLALPVMVWIHGGGLTQGSAVELAGEQLLYDGAVFARQGVVFVSINYRLGPLGYLAQRDMSEPANFGLLDQIAALHWLQSNIARFGGDPARVTIFGESAGAVSVCALLASPAANGLFDRGILQSGNCRQNLPSLTEAFEQGDRIAALAGCAGGAEPLACLRAIDGADLIAATQAVINVGPGGPEGESFGLFLDQRTLSTALGPTIRNGTAAQRPLIIGVNDDEYTTLAPASSLPASTAGYEAAIRAQLGLAANAVLQRYPASAYETPQRAYQDLLDDIGFSCPNRRAAADHAAFGNEVYHYALTEIFPDGGFPSLESFHGMDIPLLFGPRLQAQPAERQLAIAMQGAWIDFAHGLPPGSSTGLVWPSYTAATRQSVEWNSGGIGILTDYRGEYCEFWRLFVDL
jgi:para-nitrobenzyl esterase